MFSSKLCDVAANVKVMHIMRLVHHARFDLQSELGIDVALTWNSIQIDLGALETPLYTPHPLWPWYQWYCMLLRASDQAHIRYL